MKLGYKCPFCPQTYHGPIGFTNLRYHVEKKHPEEWDVFQLRKRQDVAFGQSPLTAQKQKGIKQDTVGVPLPPLNVNVEVKENMNEPNVNVQDLGKEEVLENAMKQAIDSNQQKILQQSQLPTPPPQPPVVQQPLPQKQPQLAITQLFPQAQGPDEFIENFLNKWMFKPQFVALQKYKAQRFGLPQGYELEQDALRMESGARNQPELMRTVRQFYEIEKTEYDNLTRQSQGMPPLPTPMYPGQQPQMYPGQQPQMYPGQQPQPYPQQMYPQPMYYPPPPQQNDNFTQMMIQMMQQQNQQLQTQITSMQQESQRQRDENNRMLQQEIMELKNREIQDPHIEKLETKLELLENENRRRTEAELERIKQAATNMPSPAQIQQWLKEEVEQVRTQVTAEDVKRELEKKIEAALQRRDGKTEIDVELVKAENEMKIEMAKLEQEKEKGSMWEKLLPEAMGVLSQGLQSFRSMPQKPKMPEVQETVGPPPYPENNIIEVGCRGCGQIFGVPPGFKKGQCPNCGRIIDLDAREPEQETVKPKQPPSEMTVRPPEVTVRPPPTHPETPSKTDKIGVCMDCKKDITYQNLGLQEGRNYYCKDCLSKKISESKSPEDEQPNP